MLTLGILGGAATLAHAAPIDYTMTFTLTDPGAPLPAAGSFTYDADTPCSRTSTSSGTIRTST
jgi:hypothetical protein